MFVFFKLFIASIHICFSFCFGWIDYNLSTRRLLTEHIEHSVHPSFSTGCCWWWWGAWGAVEPPTKFSKKGGSLAGTQVFEGGCWKRGNDFFQECCNL